MTSQDAYIKFLQKVNKNYINDNISVDKGRFVLLFNEAQNKYIEWVLNKKNDSDIKDIQRLLVSNYSLDSIDTKYNTEIFSLPNDFFNYVNLQLYADSENCENVHINTYEEKLENVGEMLSDEFNKPSFLFRETFHTLGGNNIYVYVDNFKIRKCLITYYRKPLNIDINGYIRIDGSSSSDINPEFSDRIVDRILSICAKDFNTNNDDYNKIGISKDRIISKI